MTNALPTTANDMTAASLAQQTPQGNNNINFSITQNEASLAQQTPPWMPKPQQAVTSPTSTLPQDVAPARPSKTYDGATEQKDVEYTRSYDGRMKEKDTYKPLEITKHADGSFEVEKKSHYYTETGSNGYRGTVYTTERVFYDKDGNATAWETYGLSGIGRGTSPVPLETFNGKALETFQWISGNGRNAGPRQVAHTTIDFTNNTTARSTGDHTTSNTAQETSTRNTVPTILQGQYTQQQYDALTAQQQRDAQNFYLHNKDALASKRRRTRV